MNMMVQSHWDGNVVFNRLTFKESCCPNKVSDIGDKHVIDLSPKKSFEGQRSLLGSTI